MSQQASDQDLWLGRIQNELGVLTTNLWLTEIQRDKLLVKVMEDTQLIEALKERIKKAEDANTELKQQIQPHRKK